MTALFIGLNLIFICSTPLESMKGVLAVGSLAASNLFGPQVAGTFSALTALSLMATVNAEVTIGPRVYYAMAKNKAFFKAAAKVHPEWHTPVTAILSQGLCAMVMTLTPFPQLAYYIGLGLGLTFFSVLSVASLFIFRRRAGWQKLRFGELLFSDSIGLHPGGRLHDRLRHRVATGGVCDRAGHDWHGCGGVSGVAAPAGGMT